MDPSSAFLPQIPFSSLSHHLSTPGVVLDLEWFIFHSWVFIVPILTADVMPGGFFLTFIIDASKYFHVIQSWQLKWQFLLHIPCTKLTFLYMKHCEFLKFYNPSFLHKDVFTSKSDWCVKTYGREMEELSTGTQFQFLVGMKTPGMTSLCCWGEL